MKYIIGVFLGALIFIVTPNSVFAWSNDVHSYTCPEETLNCLIADDADFQQNNPYLSVYHHLCLDNAQGCLARVTARYYLKKYFLTNNQDFLSVACHLYQDAWTPNHWYVPRQLPWRQGELFSPRWAGEIEGEAGFILENSVTGAAYDRTIVFKGQELHINKAYLDNVKADVISRVANEPSESLDELEAHMRETRWRTSVRSYKDVALALVFLSAVFGVLYLLSWIIRRRFRRDAKLGKIFYLLTALAILGVFYILLVLLVYR